MKRDIFVSIPHTTHSGWEKLGIWFLFHIDKLLKLIVWTTGSDIINKIILPHFIVKRMVSDNFDCRDFLYHSRCVQPKKYLSQQGLFKNYSKNYICSKVFIYNFSTKLSFSHGLNPTKSEFKCLNNKSHQQNYHVWFLSKHSRK